jgi:hypothetical protein
MMPKEKLISIIVQNYIKMHIVTNTKTDRLMMLKKTGVERRTPKYMYLIFWCFL